MSSTESQRANTSSETQPLIGSSGNRQLGEGANFEDKPWKYKAIALLCALLLSVGSHYAAHTLGALKNTIKEELGISNSEYGVLQSSVSLVNTVLPILGGAFIDAFGTNMGSILSTTLIALGNVFVAFSASYSSFPTMIVGRILYGIGSGTIVIIQETIISHWFRGKGLAIALGLQIATSRLASYLAFVTAVPLNKAVGFYGAAFWLSAVLCILSMLINILYVIIVRASNESTNSEELLRLRNKKEFKFSRLLYFPGIVWIMIWLNFIIGSGWTTFLHINSELVMRRFNVDEGHASFYASFAQFLPIFIAPFMGYVLDGFGKRTLSVIMSSLTFLFSMYTLGFTSIHPIIGMLVFSISLSIGPVCVLSGIPLVLNKDAVGTAFGVYKSANNIGNTIFDIFAGRLQDRGSDKYDSVMKFYVALGIVALILSVLIWITNKTTWHSILDMSDKKRAEHIQGTVKKDIEEKKGETSNWNRVFGGVLLVLLAISWYTFFVHIF
ncbi:MFS general substrate transporter [Basidiobolus meristosporus CBS 931.73]|uniref:Lysosomal dipeptide transporter MFSD1 n=1 Tax=Basidiobolus meristosporus CBS 931.73 TaxID=1314790 RepID=A0A1Y1XVJ7_9FUNG|nr:MFS general substrate transporter [Basidiobolus meristosporus CBS 931.73]|eukprot:ORX89781.1 MFS general substrate transporter [Basidiobolus meristosporus CBS 931.73]